MSGGLVDFEDQRVREANSMGWDGLYLLLDGEVATAELWVDLELGRNRREFGWFMVSVGVVVELYGSGEGNGEALNSLAPV